MSNTVKKNQKADVPTKNGGKYSYQYVDIAQIHEYLESNNMSYYQFIDRIDGDDYIMTVPIIDGQEKQALRGARVVDATLFGNENPAQKQGSALTYARRYSLLMAFGLATEDDDANSLNNYTKETQIKEPTEKDAKNWKFTYGKYKGSTMDDILCDDEQYIQWYIDNKATEYDKKCYELLTGEKLPTNQEQDERISLIAKMHELENETDTDHEDILKYFKVESENQLTNANINEAIKILEKKILIKEVSEE